MHGDACITLTTTEHLLRRAVNGATGKVRRPLTAMAAGANQKSRKKSDTIGLLSRIIVFILLKSRFYSDLVVLFSGLFSLTLVMLRTYPK